MVKKLLNKKNLIIVMIIVAVGLFFIPQNVYADTTTVTVSEYLKSSVAGIYQLIRLGCILALWVIIAAGFINAFFSKTPTANYLLRRILRYIGLAVVIISFLTLFIIALIDINEGLVERCREWAYDMSGVSATVSSDEYDEVTLFESAISKAYELKATSGFSGMFMYIVLVYYTVRFVIIYVRRYLYVLILILVGPIVILQNAILKTFSGKSAKVTLWVKELVFNIYIQVLHALAYSALIGFTIRFSDSALSFIGVILTLIVFASMTVIEHVVRTIFNFVGGSTSVKSTASSIGSLASSFISDPKGTAASVGESVKGIPDSLKAKAIDFKTNAVNSAVDFKNNAGKYMKDVKDTVQAKNIEVTEEEIQKERERMENPGALGKVEQAVKGAGKKVAGAGRSVKQGAQNFGKKAKGTVEGLKDLSVTELNLVKQHFIEQKNKFGQDVEAAKRISRLYKYYGKRQTILEKVKNGTATPEEIELASQFEDMDTLKGDIDQMKDGIQNSNDLVATIYKIKGPSPFIIQAKFGGFPTVGMTAIRSSIDLEKLLNGDIEGSGVKKHKRTIVLPAPNNKPVKQVEMQLEDPGKDGVFTKNNNKRYTFKEFSPGAVKTITSQVMLETLMSDGSAFSILKVRQMMKFGGVTPVGRPKNAPSASPNSMGSVDNENVTGATQNQTIRYTSKTTKENLVRSQGKRDYTFNMYRERAKDNKWARYVSADKNAKRKMNQQKRMFGGNQNEGEYVPNVGHFGLPKDRQAYNEVKQEQIVTGLIVATSMKYSKALEEIDFKNDTEFQQTLIDNLTKHGIVSEKQMNNQELREEVLSSLQEKIDSLTTDEKDVYYSFVVDLTEKAEAKKVSDVKQEQAGLKDAVDVESFSNEETGQSEQESLHNNTEAISQGETKQTEQVETEILDKDGNVVGTSKATIKDKRDNSSSMKSNRFANNTSNENMPGSNVPNPEAGRETDGKKPEGSQFGQSVGQTNFDELVEEVVEDTYRGEYREYKREKFEDRIDRIINPDNMFNTIIKATVEMGTEEAKLALDDKKEQFENLLDELGVGKNDATEFGKTLSDNYTFVKDEFTSGRAAQTMKTKAKNAVNNVEQGIKDTAKGAVDKVVETAKDAGQTVKETAKDVGHAAIDPFINQYRIKPKKSGKGDSDEEAKKEVFIFFVYGEVINQGRYEVPVLPKGKYYTVEYALNKAGWITEYADLSQLNLSEPITNGRRIQVNRKPKTVDEEAAFEEYKKIIKKVIREYISENEVKSVEALRKPMHFNSIVIRAKDKIDDEKIDKEQIRGFVERCLKELEAGDKALNMSDEGKKKLINEQNKKLEAQRLQEQLEAAERERQQKEINEQVNNAVTELFERKAEVAVIDNSGNKRTEVEEAKRMVMENDALNSLGGESNDEENV